MKLGTIVTHRAGPYLAMLRLMSIRRNKVSDAYIVFLFDDYAGVKDSLNAAIKTLVFAPVAEEGAAVAGGDGR